MTKTSMDKSYWVIKTFTDSFIEIEPKLKKSQLTLSATADDLGMGSLDWMDVIVQLERNFYIQLANVSGLIGDCKIEKLLRVCTQKLIAQKRLTPIEENMVLERYKRLETVLKDIESATPAKIAASQVKNHTK